MSLINQMLKDIDQRHAEGPRRSQVMDGLLPSLPAPRSWSLKWLAWGTLAIGVVALTYSQRAIWWGASAEPGNVQVSARTSSPSQGRITVAGGAPETTMAKPQPIAEIKKTESSGDADKPKAEMVAPRTTAQPDSAARAVATQAPALTHQPTSAATPPNAVMAPVPAPPRARLVAPQASTPARTTPSPAARAPEAPQAVKAPPAPALKPIATQPNPTQKMEKALAAKATEAVTEEPVDQSGPAATPVPRAERPRQGVVTRVLTAAQRAENAYQEALPLIQQGQLVQAQVLLEKAVSSDADHNEARLLLARLHANVGQTQQAQNLLKIGLARSPTHSEFAMAMAQIYLQSNDVPMAIATLQRSQGAAAENADFHALLGALLQHQGQHPAAKEQYLIALRLAPDSPNWLVGLAISLQALELNTAALQSYQRALDLGLPAALAQFAQARLNQLKGTH